VETPAEHALVLAPARPFDNEFHVLFFGASGSAQDRRGTTAITLSRDASRLGKSENRRVVTVLAVEEPLSPELVLVSPPEVARLARSRLSIPAARPAVRTLREPGRAELAALWLFCLAMTLGPIVLMLVIRS
jgi:hypothetical protein